MERMNKVCVLLDSGCLSKFVTKFSCCKVGAYMLPISYTVNGVEKVIIKTENQANYIYYQCITIYGII